VIGHREQKLMMSASNNAQSAVYSTSKIERERIKSVRITCGASALLSFAGNRPSKGNFKQRSGPGGVSIEYIVVKIWNSISNNDDQRHYTGYRLGRYRASASYSIGWWTIEIGVLGKSMQRLFHLKPAGFRTRGMRPLLRKSTSVLRWFVRVH
jgi:hypothetical protein